MRTFFLLLLCLCTTTLVVSQDRSSAKKEKPPIDLYKLVSAQRDTTFLDTTLSAKKMYKFNYLRKDDFELISFANVAHTYNELAYTFSEENLKPQFGARAKQFNYLHASDMHYYNVPTPLSELYFKTAFSQGQQLNGFFTINTSKRFNFSLAYKGIRSLGNYQNNLSSSGNLRFTTNYNTENNRYNIRVHITSQDFTNQENGGLTDASVTLFEEDEADFRDRGRMEVNFEDAENRFEGTRYYLEHEYALVAQKDSLSYNRLAIGNIISFEDTFYSFNQDAPFESYGESYQESSLSDKVTLTDFNAKGYVDFGNAVLGNLRGFVGYNSYNYGYDSALILDEGRITNRLKGNIAFAGAAYNKEYRGFKISGEGAINVSGDFDGNYLKGAASYALDSLNAVKASIHIHSAAPNFNFLLYQSDYVNYNWQNNFENVKTQELNFELTSKKFLDASVSYTGIDDYAYFGLSVNDSTPTPMQSNERVDYLKVKAEKEFRYGKFGLASTILYQQAVSGETVFNVPDFISRNTLYYQDEWFKKAMFMQTGVTFKYFSKYNMNAYDPVLAEFYVQNAQELGGFPLVDIFFNAKIRQTRIFFIYENANNLFTSNKSYYAAPGYPYRDPVIRFGLVWNFFL